MLSQKAVKCGASLVAVVLAGSMLFSMLAENLTTEVKHEEQDDQSVEQQKLQEQFEVDEELHERERKKMEDEKAAINAEIAEMARKGAEAACKAQETAQ